MLETDYVSVIWKSKLRCVVWFLLCYSPAYEFCVPTFRNTLFHFYPHFVHDQVYLWRFGQENWDHENYIFMHNGIYLLICNPVLVDTHFHCQFATIFPLLRRKYLAVYVEFMMRRKKSHLLTHWGGAFKLFKCTFPGFKL